MKRLIFCTFIFLLFYGNSFSTTVISSIEDLASHQKRIIVHPTRLVEDYLDFALHVEAHVLRTHELSLVFAKKLQAIYPEIDLKLVSELVLGHDNAKIDMSLEYLSDNDIIAKRKKTVLADMYDWYNLDFFTLSESEKRRSKETLDHLNSLDNKYQMDNFYKKHSHLMLDPDGKLTPLGEIYKLIEKEADQVDRYRSKVSAEEFGRQMYPESMWFNGDERIKTLIKELEDEYLEITKEYRYADYRKKHKKLRLKQFGSNNFKFGVLSFSPKEYVLKELDKRRVELFGIKPTRATINCIDQIMQFLLIRNKFFY